MGQYVDIGYNSTTSIISRHDSTIFLLLSRSQARTKEEGFRARLATYPVPKNDAQGSNNLVSDNRTDSTNDDPVRKRKRIRKLKPLHFECWNVTSLSNKKEEILIEVEKHKIYICALSETQKKSKGNTRYGDYLLVYSGRNKNERATAGFGILLHKSFENNIREIKYKDERILQVTVRFIKRKNTHLISFYAPDITKPKEEIPSIKTYSRCSTTLAPKMKL
ncbi:hypothetical protein HUJ05_001674 [Dendroctonus ponderosae]|nr:hypothetical protein HUJ05_001674 [Dendroctonus ponderosae]